MILCSVQNVQLFNAIDENDLVHVHVQMYLEMTRPHLRSLTK